MSSSSASTALVIFRTVAGLGREQEGQGRFGDRAH
jgi:hypothetical protein